MKTLCILLWLLGISMSAVHAQDDPTKRKGTMKVRKDNSATSQAQPDSSTKGVVPLVAPKFNGKGFK